MIRGKYFSKSSKKQQHYCYAPITGNTSPPSGVFMEPQSPQAPVYNLNDYVIRPVIHNAKFHRFNPKYLLFLSLFSFPPLISSPLISSPLPLRTLMPLFDVDTGLLTVSGMVREAVWSPTNQDCGDWYYYLETRGNCSLMSTVKRDKDLYVPKLFPVNSYNSYSAVLFSHRETLLLIALNWQPSSPSSLKVRLHLLTITYYCTHWLSLFLWDLYLLSFSYFLLLSLSLSRPPVSHCLMDASTRGFALVPKLALDVTSCEVMRGLQLTDSYIVPISYQVPRKVGTKTLMTRHRHAFRRDPCNADSRWYNVCEVGQARELLCL